MQTVRRLYIYLLSGITLGFLVFGLITLLQVILAQLGVGQGTLIGPEGDDWARQQLSLAAALIGVGLPVWGIHWWLAERSLDPKRPNAEDERGSTIRALYLTVVLVVLLGFGAFAARDLVREIVSGLLPQAPENYYYGSAPAASLATLLVTAAAWGYHVAVRRRDMGRGPLEGAAVWLPRVYVYGATLVALLITLQTLGDVARYAGETLWPPAADPNVDNYRSYGLADSLSLFVVWAFAWLGHWWYAGRLVSASGWRAAGERGARLRLAFFVAVILAGAFSVVRLAGEALRAILVPVFGATDAIGDDLDGTDLLRAVAIALVSAVPWAVAWWLHQRRMHEEALQADDPSRAVVATRLDLHAVALVGLAFAAVGTGWLVGLLIDVLLGGSRMVSGSGFWRAELANFVPYAILGWIAWAWTWRQAALRQAADPMAEAGSMVRRSFLMIVLAASIVSGLGSLAIVLYRLFGSLLGANLSGNSVSELSTPLGALIVAVAVALYHGLALRRDLGLRATAAPVPAEPVAAQRRLVLSGPPGSDLDGTLEALRSGLPAGYRLDED